MTDVVLSLSLWESSLVRSLSRRGSLLRCREEPEEPEDRLRSLFSLISDS